MTGLSVVLINPRDEGNRGVHPRHKCTPPLGLLYLGAALERAGHRVTVVEANAWQLSEAEVAHAVLAARPDLVGLPVLVPVERAVRRLVAGSRAAGLTCPVVLGGASVTTTPARVMEQLEGCDYLLRGYAEAGMVALCELLRGRLAREAVPGLVWREGPEAIFSPVEPATPNPAEGWRPAKHLVAEAYRQRRYFSLLERSRAVDTVITSLGCPCRCGYCYNVRPLYLTRPPEDVVAELVDARARGVTHIELVDDNFTLDRARAMRIFELMIQERLGLRLIVKSRPERVDPELLARARQAGVYQVSFGMESGAQPVLDAMGRGVRVADNERACALTKAAGLLCHTSWIVGYPGETPETLRATMGVVRRMRPTTAVFGVLRPYPGTRVYLEAQAAGTLVGDWSVHSAEVPWVRLPWARSRRDLTRALTRAKLAWYGQPATMLSAARLLARADRSALGFAAREGLNVLRGALRARRREEEP
ncbi:MAG: radical SAM protein [Pseudomonadota bacterium]